MVGFFFFPQVILTWLERNEVRHGRSRGACCRRNPLSERLVFSKGCHFCHYLGVFGDGLPATSILSYFLTEFSLEPCMYRLKIDSKLHTTRKHSSLFLCMYAGTTLGSLETTVFPLLQAPVQGDAGVPGQVEDPSKMQEENRCWPGRLVSDALGS